MAIKTINPKETKNLYDQFHFSQAVRAGELLICSGQIGTGADGRVPADLAEEFRNAWQQGRRRVDGCKIPILRRGRVHVVPRGHAEHDRHVHEGAR